MNDFITILNQLLSVTTGTGIVTNPDGTIDLGVPSAAGLNSLKKNITTLSTTINTLYTSPTNLNAALIICLEKNSQQPRTIPYLTILLLLVDLFSFPNPNDPATSSNPSPSTLPDALKPITPSLLQTLLNIDSPTLASDINTTIRAIITKYTDPTNPSVFPACSLASLNNTVTNLFGRDISLQALLICMNAKKVA